MQFVEWKANDHVTLKRWGGYWQKNGDSQTLPYLDGIYYRLIIDDTVRSLEMQAGSIDITENVPSRELSAVKSNPDLVYIEGPWSGYQYRVAFNSASPVFKESMSKRQGLLHAIDREAVVRSLGGGTGVAAKSLLSPGVLGYDSTSPYWWYDLAKARLLTGDLPAPLTLNLLSVTRQTDRLQANLLKGMWESIGYRVNIEAVELLVHRQRTLETHMFEVTTVRNLLLPDPDAVFDRHFSSAGTENYSGYTTAEMEQCIKDGSSVYSPNERAAIYRRCQRIAYEAAWFAPIWNQPWNWLISRKVRGFAPSWGANWELREAWLER
jgi:peptide/nickel transport system substrate-binding protein